MTTLMPIYQHLEATQAGWPWWVVASWFLLFVLNPPGLTLIGMTALDSVWGFIDQALWLMIWTGRNELKKKKQLKAERTVKAKERGLSKISKLHNNKGAVLKKETRTEAHFQFHHQFDLWKEASSAQQLNWTATKRGPEMSRIKRKCW